MVTKFYKIMVLIVMTMHRLVVVQMVDQCMRWPKRKKQS
jgi:hypothetical protein